MKKKSVKKISNQRRKMWIIVLSAATLLLIVLTAPVWFLFIVVFLFSLDRGDPSTQELKSFQNIMVQQEAVQAKAEVEKRGKEILTFPTLKSGKIEASAFGNRCYAKHSGGVFSDTYEKTCFVRKTVLLSSADSFRIFESKLKNDLISREHQLTIYSKEEGCIEGEIEPIKRGNQSNVYFQMGSIDECRESVDPITAHRAPRTAKKIDIQIESYDLNRIMTNMKLHKRKSYIVVSIDKNYFSDFFKK